MCRPAHWFAQGAGRDDEEFSPVFAGTGLHARAFPQHAEDPPGKGLAFAHVQPAGVDLNDGVGRRRDRFGFKFFVGLQAMDFHCGANGIGFSRAITVGIADLYVHGFSKHDT